MAFWGDVGNFFKKIGKGFEGFFGFADSGDPSDDPNADNPMAVRDDQKNYIQEDPYISGLGATNQGTTVRTESEEEKFDEYGRPILSKTRQ
jgi:hypothetical protein